MFNKVLIANRGAIACRIIRTLRQMGIGSVAVYSEADAESPHVARPTRPSASAPAPAAESYLAMQRILEAARPAGAQAIHPGYGFLTENARLRRGLRGGRARLHRSDAGSRCAPSASSTRRARWRGGQACRCCRAPACWPTWTRAGRRRDASAIPVMLKSTAGGGGIGMQLCRSRRAAHRLRVGEAAGADQLLGRRRLSGEVHQRCAPHRGADLRRRPRQRARARRARLLGAAPQPEGDRGDAGAGLARRGAPGAAGHRRAAGRKA